MLMYYTDSMVFFQPGYHTMLKTYSKFLIPPEAAPFNHDHLLWDLKDV
jgi:hypothetical protein